MNAETRKTSQGATERNPLDQNTAFGTSGKPQGFVATWKDATHLWRARALLCMLMALILAVMQPGGPGLYKAWAAGDGLMAGVATQAEAVSSFPVVAEGEATFYPDFTKGPKLSPVYYPIGTASINNSTFVRVQEYADESYSNWWALRRADFQSLLSNPALYRSASSQNPIGLPDSDSTVGRMGAVQQIAGTDNAYTTSMAPNTPLPKYDVFWALGYTLDKWVYVPATNLATKVDVTFDGKNASLASEGDGAIVPWGIGTTGGAYTGNINQVQVTSASASTYSSIGLQLESNNKYPNTMFFGSWTKTGDYEVRIALPDIMDDESPSRKLAESVDGQYKGAWDSEIVTTNFKANEVVGERSIFFDGRFEWRLNKYLGTSGDHLNYSNANKTKIVVTNEALGHFGTIFNPQGYVDRNLDPAYSSSSIYSGGKKNDSGRYIVVLTPVVAVNYDANGGTYSDWMASTKAYDVVDLAGTVQMSNGRAGEAAGYDIKISHALPSDPSEVGIEAPENKVFRGWSTIKGATTANVTNNNTTLTGSMTYYAVWGNEDDAAYTVKVTPDFAGSEGAAVSIAGVPKGTALKDIKFDEEFNYTPSGEYGMDAAGLIADPDDLVGFRQTGWSGGGLTGTVATLPDDAKVTSNITDLVLRFEAIPKYAVHFMDDTTELSELAQSVYEGDTAEEPASPAAPAGSSFDRWYSDSDLTAPFDFTSPITAETSVYAKWKKAQYTVTLHADEYDGDKYIQTHDEPITVDYGQTVAAAFPELEEWLKLTDTPLVQGSNADFSGWYTASTKAQGKLWGLATSAVTSNMDLYAVWETPDPTVEFKFYANGGNYGSDSNTTTLLYPKKGSAVDFATEAPTPIAPDGFTFDGWYTAASGGSKVESVPNASNDQEFYAHWLKKNAEQFPVHFMNGTMEMPELLQMVSESSSPTRPSASDADPYAPTGFELDGWYTDSELTTEYDFSSGIVGETSFYAKWKLKSFTVTLHAADQDLNYPTTSTYQHPVTVEYGKTVASSWSGLNSWLEGSGTPDKEGFVDQDYFAGWYTGAPGSSGPTGSLWGLAKSAVTSNMDLWATWDEKQDTVTVTLKAGANGYFGTESVTETEIYANKGDNVDITAAPVPIAKEGFVFAGWYPESGGSEVKALNNIQQDTVLVAHWDADLPTHTVRFVSDGVDYVEPQQVIDGGTATVPDPAPSKDRSTGFSFAGWTTDSTLAGSPEDPSKRIITDDVTFYAKWDRLWKVSFCDVYDGDEYLLTAVYVADGATVEPIGLSDPAFDDYEVDGYDLAGWYTAAEGGTEINFGNPVTANVKYYAHWTPKKYTVTYYKDAAKTTQYSQNVDYDDTWTTADQAATTFTKTGSTLASWNTKADGSGDPYALGASQTAWAFTKNLDLYAQWDTNTYDITYKPNIPGDTTTADVVETGGLTYGSTWTAKPASTFTRTGYTLAGWDEDAKASPDSPTYAPDAAAAAWNKEQDLTLFAIWKAKEQGVTYNANGGALASGTQATQAVSFGAKWTTYGDSDVSRAGYTLDSWNTKADGTGTKHDKSKDQGAWSSEDNLTLYAVWTPETYTVHFNSNDGAATITTDSKPVTYGQPWTTNTTKTFARTGYSLLGWSTDSNATAATYSPNSSVGNWATTNDLTLYAVWSQDTYTINFSGIKNGDEVKYSLAGGADQALSGTSFTYTSNDLPVVINSASRSGYTFGGWSDDSAPAAGAFPVSITISAENANVSSKNLTANWTANPYTITYNANGGDSTAASVTQSVTYDGSWHPTKDGYFSRNGYALLGWSADSNATAATYTSSDTYTWATAGNQTLYAVWEANSYDVTLFVQHGTINDSAPGGTKQSSGGFKFTTQVKYGQSPSSLNWAGALGAVTVNPGYKSYDATTAPGTWQGADPTQSATTITGNASYTWIPDAETYNVMVKVVGTGNDTANSFVISGVPYDTKYDAITFDNSDESAATRPYSSDSGATPLSAAIFNAKNDSAHYSNTGTWSGGSITGTPTALPATSKVTGNVELTYTFDPALHEVKLAVVNGLYDGDATAASGVSIKDDVPDGTDAKTVITPAVVAKIATADAAMYTTTGGTWSPADPTANGTKVTSDVTYTYTLPLRTYSVKVTPTGAMAATANAMTITGVPYGTALADIKVASSKSGNTIAYDAGGVALSATALGFAPESNRESTGVWGWTSASGSESDANLPSTTSVTGDTNLTWTFDYSTKEVDVTVTGGKVAIGTDELTSFKISGVPFDTPYDEIAINTTVTATGVYAFDKAGTRLGSLTYTADDGYAASTGAWSGTGITGTVAALGSTPTVQGTASLEYKYKKEHTVTFSLLTGMGASKWGDGTSAPKTVKVIDGDTLSLSDIPTGMVPGVGYYTGVDPTDPMASKGYWDGGIAPNTTTPITGDTEFKYRFTKVHTVTYEAASSAKWSDGTSVNRVEYVFDGDALASIPTGSPVSAGYDNTANWAASTPTESTKPTGDVTYTLSFEPKEVSYKVEYWVQKVNASANTVPPLTGAENATFEKLDSQTQAIDTVNIDGTGGNLHAGDNVTFDAGLYKDLSSLGFTRITGNTAFTGTASDAYKNAPAAITLDGTANDVFKVYYARDEKELSYSYTNNKTTDTWIPSTEPASKMYYVGAEYTVDDTDATAASGTSGKYTFDGWYKNGASSKATGTQTMSASGDTLRGTWSKGSFTVKFVNTSGGGEIGANGAGQTYDAATETVTATGAYGDTLNLPTVSGGGNKVLRWKLGGTVVSVPGTFEGNATYEAEWVDPFDITYSPDGDGVGTFTARTQSVNSDSASGTTIKAFSGITTDPDGNAYPVEDPSAAHKWGYGFKEWKYKSSGGQTGSSTDLSGIVGTTVNANWEFEAVYEAKDHAVSFKAETLPSGVSFGSYAPSPSTTKTGENVVAVPTAAQVTGDTGYTITYGIYVKGSDNNDHLVKTLNSGAKLSVTPDDIDGLTLDSGVTIPDDAEITIKPSVSQNNYKVTYAWSPSDALSETPDQRTDAHYKERISIDSSKDAPEGYNFVGWSLSDSGTSIGGAGATSYAGATFDMPNNDVVVTGTWAKKNYKIVWQAATGYTADLGIAGGTQSIQYGSTSLTPPTVTTTSDGKKLDSSNSRYTDIKWTITYGEDPNEQTIEYDEITAATDTFANGTETGYDGVITIVGTPVPATYSVTVNVVNGTLDPKYDGVGKSGDATVNPEKTQVVFADQPYGADVYTILGNLGLQANDGFDISKANWVSTNPTVAASGETVKGQMVYTVTYGKKTFTVDFSLASGTDEGGAIELVGTTSFTDIEYGTPLSSIAKPTLQNKSLSNFSETYYTSLTWGTADPVTSENALDESAPVTDNITLYGMPKKKTYEVTLRLVGATFKDSGLQQQTVTGLEYGASAADLKNQLDALEKVRDAGYSAKADYSPALAPVTENADYTLTYEKYMTVTFKVEHGTWTKDTKGDDHSGSDPIVFTNITPGTTLGNITNLEVLPEATADAGYTRNGADGWDVTPVLASTAVNSNLVYTWSASPNGASYTVKRWYQKVTPGAEGTEFTAADYELVDSKSFTVDTDVYVDEEILVSSFAAANRTADLPGFNANPVSHGEVAGGVVSDESITLQPDAEDNVINLYFDRKQVSYSFSIANPAAGPAAGVDLPSGGTVRYGTELTSLDPPTYKDPTDTSISFGGWKVDNVAVTASSENPYKLENDSTEFVGTWATAAYDVEYRIAPLEDNNVDAGAKLTLGEKVDQTSITVPGVFWGSPANAAVEANPSDDKRYEFAYWTYKINDAPVMTDEVQAQEIRITNPIDLAAVEIRGANYVFYAHFVDKYYTVEYTDGGNVMVNPIIPAEGKTTFQVKYGAWMPVPGNSGGTTTSSISQQNGDGKGNPVLKTGVLGYRIGPNEADPWGWKTTDTKNMGSKIAVASDPVESGVEQEIGTTKVAGSSQTWRVIGDVTFVPNVVERTYDVYYRNTSGTSMASKDHINNVKWTESVFKGLDEATLHPKNPVWTAGGKTFVGWRVGTNATTEPPETATLIKPDQDATVSGVLYIDTVPSVYLWAQFENDSATLVYHQNASDTDTTVDSQATEFTAMPTIKSLAETGFTKTGYKFAGWNTEADGSGTSYAAGAKTLTVDAATIDLYAQWTPITYTVKWMGPDNTLLKDAGGDLSQTVTYGETGDYLNSQGSAFTSANLVLVNWIYNGRTIADGADIDPDLTTIDGATVVLTPVYAGTVTLTFTAGNVGADTVSSMPAAMTASRPVENPTTGAASFTLPTTEPVRQGYNFTGWKVGTATKKAGETLALSADSTAVAQWTAGQSNYHVERYLETGLGTNDFVKDESFDDGNPTAKTASTKAISATQASGAPYQPEGYEYAVALSTWKSTIAADGSSVLKLYYTAKGYTVTYEYEGTDGAIDPPVKKSAAMVYGTDYTLEPVPTPAANPANWPDGYTTADTEWYVVDADDNPVTATGGKVTVQGNLTAKLRFTDFKITATFKLGPHGKWTDGTDPSQVKTETPISYKGKPTMNDIDAEPESNLYEFVGWSTVDAPNTAIDPRAIELTEDVTYIATFKIKHAVTWDLGSHYAGGAGAEGDLTLFEQLLDTDPLPDPTITLVDSSGNPLGAPGYTFDGWLYGEETYGNVASAQADIGYVTTDMKLVAQWKKTTNTVKFVFGSGAADSAGEHSVTGELDDPKKAPSAPTAKLGYTFAGWTGSMDGKARSLAAGADFNMPATDSTLTGVWDKDVVTISFAVEDLEGDEVADGVTSKTRGTVTVGQFTNVERADNPNTYSVTAVPSPGYKFVKWTDAEGNTVGTDWNNPDTDSVLTVQKNSDDLYDAGAYTAHFERALFSVTFTNPTPTRGSIDVGYANGNDQQVVYEGSPTVNPTPAEGVDYLKWDSESANYTFGGWDYTVWPADGGDSYDATSPVMDPSEVSIVGRTVFKATWLPKEAEVAYLGNGLTSGSMAIIQHLKADSDHAVLASGYTYAGHDFVGWNTAADGSGTSYQPGDTMVLQAGSNELYAQWDAAQVTVRYLSNPTDEAVSEGKFDKKVPFGSDATALAIADTGFAPTNDGAMPAQAREFKEWNTSPDGTGTSIAAGGTINASMLSASTNPDDGLKLYAIWQDRTFTILLDGGKGVDGIRDPEDPDNKVIKGGTMKPVPIKYGGREAIPANEYVREDYTFTGWYDEGANGKSTRGVFATDGAAGNYSWPNGYFEDTLTLYAQWKATEHHYINFLFYNDDGSLLEDISLYAANEDGQKLSATPMASVKKPSRAGASFEGWTPKLKEGPTLDEDMTIQEILEEYYSDDSPYGYKPYWNKGVEPHTFYDTYANGNSVTVSVYAKYENTEYTVQFEPNAPAGHSDSEVTKMADQPVGLGETVPLATNEYAFEGYTFAGWRLAGSSNTTVYQDEYILHPAGDGGILSTHLKGANDTNLTAVLVAQWTPVSNVVNFVSQYRYDGVLGTQPDVVWATSTGVNWTDGIALPEGESDPVVYDAQNADFMFNGWYAKQNESSSGGIRVDVGGAEPTTFDELIKSMESAHYGVHPNSEGVFSITLYASYTKSGVRLTYVQGEADTNAGLPDVQTASVDSESGASVTLKPNAMAKKGYVPAGWKITRVTAADVADQDDLETALLNKEVSNNNLTYDFGPEVAGAEIELSPVFVESAYTVKYNYDTVANTVVHKATKDGDELVSYQNSFNNLHWTSDNFLPDNAAADVATAEGYTFAGWYPLDPTVNTTVAAITNATTIADLAAVVDGGEDNANDTNNREFTLYAKWNPVDFTVKYNLGGGTLTDDSSPAAKTGLHWDDSADAAGNPVVIPTTQLKNFGHSNPVWYIDAGFTTPVTGTTIAGLASDWHSVAGNESKELPTEFTLFAKWTEDVVPLTFRVNDGDHAMLSFNLVGRAYSVNQVVFGVGAETGKVYTVDGEENALTSIPEITARERAGSGYTFKGWVRQNGTTTPIDPSWVQDAEGTKILVGDHNSDAYGTTRFIAATYVANFSAAADTGFTVEAYYQQPDGSWPTNPDKVLATLTGTTGDDVAPIDFAGNEDLARDNYVFDAESPRTTEATTIAGNGTTVVGVGFKLRAYDLDYVWAWEHSDLTPTAPDLPDGEEGVRVGQTVDLPESPKAPEGWVFDGWYDGDPTAEESTATKIDGDTYTMPAGNAQVFGYFKLKSNTPYEVHAFYQQQDGEWPETADEGDRIIGESGTTGAFVDPATYADRPEFAKDHYHFAEEKSEPVAIAPDGSTVVKVYYALYAQTLDFAYTWKPTPTNAEKRAFVLPDTMNYRVEGEVITLPTAAELTAPAGWSFDGWYDADPTAAGSTANKLGTTFTMPGEDATLYGHWVMTGGTYAVTFNANGPGFSADGEQITPAVGSKSTFERVTCGFGDARLGAGKVPTAAGYTFEGWYYGNKLVSDVDIYSALVNNDRTVSSIQLVAHYVERDDYTVVFDTNAGEGARAAMAANPTVQPYGNELRDVKWTQLINGAGLTEDSEANAYTMTNPTWAGRMFLGWAPASDGAVIEGLALTDEDDQPGAALSALAAAANASEDAKVITLYAVWDDTLYGVTYHDDGASGDEKIVDKQVYGDKLTQLKYEDSVLTDAWDETYRRAFVAWTYTDEVGVVHEVDEETTVAKLIEEGALKAEDGSFLITAKWQPKYEHKTVYLPYTSNARGGYDVALPLDGNGLNAWIDPESDSFKPQLVKAFTSTAPATVTSYYITDPTYGIEKEDGTKDIPGYLLKPETAEMLAQRDGYLEFWDEDGVELAGEDVVYYIPVIDEKKYIVKYDLNDKEELAAGDIAAEGDTTPKEVRVFTDTDNIPDDSDIGGKNQPTRAGFTFDGWHNQQANIDGDFGVEVEVPAKAETMYGDLSIDGEGNWIEPEVDPNDADTGYIMLFAKWIEKKHIIKYKVADGEEGIQIKLQGADDETYGTYADEVIGAATADVFEGDVATGFTRGQQTQGAIAKVDRGYTFGGWYALDSEANELSLTPVLSGGSGGSASSEEAASQEAEETNSSESSATTQAMQALSTQAEVSGSPYMSTEAVTPGVDDTKIFPGVDAEDPEDKESKETIYIATTTQNDLVPITLKPYAQFGDSTGDLLSNQPWGTYVGEVYTKGDDGWGTHDGQLPPNSSYTREGWTFQGWRVPAGTVIDGEGALAEATVITADDPRAARIVVPQNGIEIEGVWTENTSSDPEPAPSEGSDPSKDPGTEKDDPEVTRYAVSVIGKTLSDGTVIDTVTTLAESGKKLTDDEIKSLLTNSSGKTADKWVVTYTDASGKQHSNEAMSVTELVTLLKSLPIRAPMVMTPADDAKGVAYDKPTSDDGGDGGSSGSPSPSPGSKDPSDSGGKSDSDGKGDTGDNGSSGSGSSSGAGTTTGSGSTGGSTVTRGTTTYSSTGGKTAPTTGDPLNVVPPVALTLALAAGVTLLIARRRLKD